MTSYESNTCQCWVQPSMRVWNHTNTDDSKILFWHKHRISITLMWCHYRSLVKIYFLGINKFTKTGGYGFVKLWLFFDLYCFCVAFLCFVLSVSVFVLLYIKLNHHSFYDGNEYVDYRPEFDARIMRHIARDKAQVTNWPCSVHLCVHRKRNSDFHFYWNLTLWTTC